ncbi:MAG: hypothetical protein K2X51_12525 [Burkholderiales bacterium]|nr:hypothetical protein [Burkholderiales bacterium]
MLFTILACAAIAILAVVAIGVALLPLCLISGGLAWLRANKLDAQAEETGRLLAQQ